jgi:hypothetical protein
MTEPIQGAPPPPNDPFTDETRPEIGPVTEPEQEPDSAVNVEGDDEEVDR